MVKLLREQELLEGKSVIPKMTRYHCFAHSDLKLFEIVPFILILPYGRHQLLKILPFKQSAQKIFSSRAAVQNQPKEILYTITSTVSLCCFKVGYFKLGYAYS